MELVAVLRGCRQPLFRDFPPGDFGGTGNIGCADHIRVVKMTAGSTQKQSPSKTITAIDDATRIRALKIYEKHTQENSISFLDYVIGKFPFRIHTIRPDNGHEFQVKFHWYVLDLGMDHVYIKPRTPRLNGKVERSHSTDQ